MLFIFIILFICIVWKKWLNIKCFWSQSIITLKLGCWRIQIVHYDTANCGKTTQSIFVFFNSYYWPQPWDETKNRISQTSMCYDKIQYISTSYLEIDVLYYFLCQISNKVLVFSIMFIHSFIWIHWLKIL